MDEQSLYEKYYTCLLDIYPQFTADIKARILCIQTNTDDGYGDVSSLYNILQCYNFDKDFSFLCSNHDDLSDNVVSGIKKEIKDNIRAYVEGLRFLASR